ncbi:MAG: CHASE3 domain-containing protein [Vampirovibrionales bacterium]|nr:CHASE3 domain-containing protein [Vampirovibrionales bacterium]
MHKSVISMLLGSLILLLCIAGVTFWSQSEAGRAKEQLYRSLTIREQMTYLFFLVLDMESNTRGYAITGKKSFLEPFANARSQVRSVKTGLMSIAKDRRVIQQLPSLFTLIDQKITHMERIIDQPSQQDARLIVLTGQGQLLSGQIRQKIDALGAIETKLQRDALTDSKNADWWSRALMGLGFLLATSLQLWAFYLLSREIHQRQQMNDDLGKLNKELEAFSYSVSHDLRAPLRSISGFSQALLSHKASLLDDEAREFLDRIMANSQRMGSLIDDLLQLSRLSRAELNKQEINLSQMAQAIAADLKTTHPERSVEIAIAPDLTATADKALIYAVLENLIGNAWKFTAKASHAQIRVGQRLEGDRNVFFVQDNGAGFDMKYAHKLFGAFQRLHSVSEFAGNGIGLATVQRILHRHGGSIWCEGEPGKGATFSFTL